MEDACRTSNQKISMVNFITATFLCLPCLKENFCTYSVICHFNRFWPISLICSMNDMFNSMISSVIDDQIMKTSKILMSIAGHDLAKSDSQRKSSVSQKKIHEFL